MGYGKNLERAIKNKGMSIRGVAALANISADTLYSIIRRDSSVRFDQALRLSSLLSIRVADICKDIPSACSEMDRAILVMQMFRCLDDNGSGTPLMLLVGFEKIYEERKHKEIINWRKRR